MKKTLFLSVLLLALFLGSQPAYSADNFSHDVTIVVPVTITLAMTVGAGGITLNTGNAFADITSRYTLQHNNAANIKITAQITANTGDETGLGLTTNVSTPGVGASAGAVALIAAGVINVAAQDVVTAIPAGSYLAGYQIAYGATYDFTSTLGAQAFTVTYTALP